MGHVDSGKTSLVRALSTHLSTASLDKHPQSQERGITLDLGFSSFLLPSLPPSPPLQVTLVDCPGHGSLIRTIIGGAQIIDLVLLLVDATRGLQAQTVECVILAEITTPTLVIALNKIDLLPEEEREEKVKEVTASLRKALKGSRFEHAPIVPVAAVVGGEKSVGAAAAAAAAGGAGAGGAAATAGAGTAAAGGKKKKDKKGEEGGKEEGTLTTTTTTSSSSSSSSRKNVGLDELCRTLQDAMRRPRRSATGPLYLAVDHCFPIKGQGTVLTGTKEGGREGGREG
jgi:selenocysteine-specific elongation factor